jgi:hypothetical protein
MFPKIQKRLVALTIGTLSYLTFCVWVARDLIPKPPESIPEPTEASAIAAAKLLEIKQKEMLAMSLKLAAQEQAEKARWDAEEKARLKRQMEDGRQGCLDDRGNAYLQVPLKVVDPVFRPCAASLLNNTNIPLILPPNATQIHQYSSDPVTLYAYLDFNATGYSIGLTHDPRDHYQLNQASYSGEVITEKSPILSKYYEEELIRLSRMPSFEAQRQTVGTVTLINGLRGYYLPPVCGWNCNSAYASIQWDQNGYRYTVSIKMGRKEKVLELVNAAIANQSH